MAVKIDGNGDIQGLTRAYSSTEVSHLKPNGDATNVKSTLDSHENRIIAVEDRTASDIEFTPTGTVSSTNIQAAIAEVVSDLASSSGASSVGYLPAGAGAVATTVESRLRNHDQALANVEGNLNFTTLVNAQTPVADSDLLILRQGNENKKLPISVVRTELATDAVDAANLAVSAKVLAESARDAAQLSKGVFPSTATALSKGVVSIGAIVAGTGGTDGTFDLAFSGGGGSGATGRFVVSGGKITDVIVTSKGNSYTTAPTVSFSASSGLTGASGTAVIGNLVAENEYFSVPSATNSQSLILYQNSSGAAVEVKRYPSSEQLSDFAPMGYKFAIMDSDGNASFGIKDDGTTQVTDLVAEDVAASSVVTDALSSRSLNTIGLVESNKTDYSFVIVDDSGGDNIAFGIKADGGVYVSDLDATSINGAPGASLAAVAGVADTATLAGYAFSIQDGQGRVAFGLKADGTVRVKEVETDNLVATALTLDSVNTDSLTVSTINNVPVEQYLGGSGSSGGVPTFTAEINHVFTYGQSLSVGATSTPVVTSSQMYDSLKFDGGVRPHDTNTRTALVALTETAKGSLGETPSAGTAHAIKQLIASENRISYTQQNYQMLLSADGEGGQTIAALTNSSGSYYPRLLASMQAGYNLAQAAGKTYNVPAFTWTQGEADYGANTASATYIAALETLRLQIENSAKSICGQSNDVEMICYQVATHKIYGKSYPWIALAQLQASNENPRITMATPMYHLPYSSDRLHLTAAGSKYLGFYYGLAYKRVVIDGGEWRPLQPISQIKQGSILTVRFHVPRGPLVLDTTTVSQNTNYGFNLFDAGGNAININSVALTGPDTVKIVAAATIPTGAKLQYAFYGTENGGANGPRGNLRDSQGDLIVFDPTGLNYPAHNWCAMFELTI